MFYAVPVRVTGHSEFTCRMGVINFLLFEVFYAAQETVANALYFIVYIPSLLVPIGVVTIVLVLKLYRLPFTLYFIVT